MAYNSAQDSGGEENPTRGRHASPESYAAEASEASTIRDAYGAERYGSGAGSGSYTGATAQTEATGAPQFDSGNASDYSANNYGNGGGKSHKKSGKKKHHWLRIILLVILALIVAAGIAVAVYVHQLDQKLGFDDSNSASVVKSALTSTGNDKPFYVLLLGSDSRKYSTSSEKKGVSAGDSRSDVMMLVRVDAANRKLTLVSIPRDTRWYNPKTKKVGKINAAYNDGPAASIKAVETLTGVKISHYAQINIDGFESLVDTVGGIEVYVPKKIGYKDALTKQYVEVQKGWQTLNGQQAQIFARVRHDFKEGDGARQKHNQQIIEALLASIKKQPIQNMPSVGLAIADCLDTDFDSGQLLPLAKQFLSGDITIYNGAGPIDGDVYQDDKTWYCYNNTSGWKKLIKTVNEGKNPKKMKYKTPELPVQQAHNEVDCDTVHDPSTAVDLSGNNDAAIAEYKKKAPASTSSSTDGAAAGDAAAGAPVETTATGEAATTSQTAAADAAPASGTAASAA